MGDRTQAIANVIDVLNATTLGWGITIEDARRSSTAIATAVDASGMELLRAGASNPKNVLYGILSRMVDVVHNEILEYDGEPGVPFIVPFSGATSRAGVEATAQEIDSWREDPASYTGGVDGVPIPHDQAGPRSRPSPLSCRFNITNKLFKFTGASAQIPLVQIDALIAADPTNWFNNLVPLSLQPVVVKLSPAKLVKPGDALYQLAGSYQSLGEQDLIDVKGGMTQSKPAPPPSVFLQRASA